MLVEHIQGDAVVSLQGNPFLIVFEVAPKPLEGLNNPGGRAGDGAVAVFGWLGFVGRIGAVVNLPLTDELGFACIAAPLGRLCLAAQRYVQNTHRLAHRMRADRHLYMYTYISIYIYIYMCVCVSMCVYIYMYVYAHI